MPRDTEITNWRNALYVCTNGNLGIGSKNTFFRNQEDKEFIVASPEKTILESRDIEIDAQGHITLRGKVGVNAFNNTSDYALAVDGGILTDKVLIRNVDEWHAAVFSDDYKLMPLNELKDYVTNHHHLPDVPSESEVMEEGYDMGEMQGLLLKKIEELTLYTIQLKELVERQQKEIDELKAK